MVSDSVSGASAVIRFNGKKISIGEYAFRVFVQEKGLLQSLDVTKKAPTATATNETEVETWNTNNAKVLSWLIGVDTPIALTFRSFKNAAEVWTHLEQVYKQVSSNRLFDLEYELASLVQGIKL